MRPFLLCAAASLTLSLASSVEAQPAKARNWSRSNAFDYALTGISTGVLIGEVIVNQPTRPPLRWTDPILFDTDVRDALRVSDAGARSTFENVAWGLFGLQAAYPVLVDIPLAWARYGPDVARDLFWQDAVTLTFAGMLDLGLRDLVGRARPYTWACLASRGSHCLDPIESTRSFPGGHTINSTAASVLTCTQHLKMRLYGGPWDGIVCATTLTSNLTLAVMRIMSDNHWATDQIVGLAIGAVVGFGAPYLLHFRRETSALFARVGVSRDAIVVPVPILMAGGGGLGIGGAF